MANTYLTRTLGTPTNNKKWTFSAWIKKGYIGTNDSQIIFSAGGDGSNYASIMTNYNPGKLQFYSSTGGNQTGGSVRLNNVLRDVSGWYHIVISFDSTDSTAADRIKFYINGNRETSYDNAENPNQNVSSFINSAIEHQIGKDSYRSNQYAGWFNGSVSHLHFIDGTAYDASAFGETDTTTGEWKAKTSPSVTYGTNGFFILKDSNLVTDQSGRGNNFTVGGGTLTNLKDNPDNTFATLNPLTIGGTAATLGNVNNSIVGGANNAEWYTASTIAPSTGKWYVEIKNDFASGQAADLIVGFTTNLIDVKNEAFPGKEPHSLGLWSAGTDVGDIKIDNSVVSNQYTGDWGSANKILGMALDLDNKKVYFSIDGVWQSSANPSAGSGGYDFSSSLTPFEDNYFIAIGSYSNSLTINKCSVNFGNGLFGTTAITTNSGNGYAGAEGASKFNYTVPTGYSALSTKGLNE